jgi:hypothetical protein
LWRTPKLGPLAPELRCGVEFDAPEETRGVSKRGKIRSLFPPWSRSRGGTRHYTGGLRGASWKLALRRGWRAATCASNRAPLPPCVWCAGGPTVRFSALGENWDGGWAQNWCDTEKCHPEGWHSYVPDQPRGVATASWLARSRSVPPGRSEAEGTAQ